MGLASPSSDSTRLLCIWLPVQIVESVIICLKLEVMWRVHDLKEDQSPSKVSSRVLSFLFPPPFPASLTFLPIPSLPHFSPLRLQEALRTVRQKMVQLFKDCEQLVKLGEGCAQREAYVMFTDVLQVFSRLLRKHAHLSSLVYVPEPSLQQTLQVSHWASVRTLFSRNDFQTLRLSTFIVLFSETWYDASLDVV